MKVTSANYAVFVTVLSILYLLTLPTAAGQTAWQSYLTGDVTVLGGTQFGTSNFFIRGDVIQFFGNSYNEDQDDTIMIPGATFDIRILDPNNIMIFRQNFTSDENGSIRFSLPVTEDFKFGKYLIHFLISKEGYDTYPDESEYYSNQFYVVRTANDIVPAMGYDFQIRAQESEINLYSYGIIKGKISPSPAKLLASEEFVDPTTGIIVQPFKFITHFYFTRPDGLTFNSYVRCGALDCDTNRPEGQFFANRVGDELEGQFFANKVGRWSAYAIIRWVEDGVMYEAKSDPVDVSVSIKPSLFQGYTPEEINIEELRSRLGIEYVEPISIEYVEPVKLQFTLLDWTSDGKFILFSCYGCFRVNSSSDQGVKFGMMTPDASHVNKIDIPIKHLDWSEPRLSPSNDSILVLGRQQDKDSIKVFRYDIEEQKIVKITSREGKNRITSFDWMPDGNIVLGEELRNENHEYIGYNLWLADSSGNKTTKLYSWSFDPISLQLELFDKRPHFQQFDVSPDGKKIALVSYKVEEMLLEGGYRTPTNYHNLTIFDIEKKEFKDLAVAVPGIFSPRWSPDSEFVIYNRAPGFRTPNGLEITNIDGTIHETLLIGIEDPRDQPATFVISPDGRFILMGIDTASYDGAVSKVFRMEFMQPIPEFPISIMIVTLAIGLMLGIMRLRNVRLSLH